MAVSVQPLADGYYTEASGVLTGLDARVAVEQLDRIVYRRSGLFGFNDWWGIERYENSARLAFIQFILRHRHALSEVHVLSPNVPLLTMSVQVANVALGGFLTLHHDRNSFAARLERQRANNV